MSLPCRSEIRVGQRYGWPCVSGGADLAYPRGLRQQRKSVARQKLREQLLLLRHPHSCPPTAAPDQPYYISSLAAATESRFACLMESSCCCRHCSLRLRAGRKSARSTDRPTWPPRRVCQASTATAALQLLVHRRGAGGGQVQLQGAPGGLLLLAPRQELPCQGDLSPSS